jgi:hypothetical protein
MDWNIFKARAVAIALPAKAGTPNLFAILG